MSSICFSTIDGDVRVSGRERARMAGLCQRMLLAQMDVGWPMDLGWIRNAVAPGHYLSKNPIRGDVETFLKVGMDPLFLDGKKISIFELQLNSVVQWGSQSAQLAAKLHAQCEIHSFCEPKDRSWLADVIEQAIEDKILDPKPMGYDGWNAVTAMLRSCSSLPVVTSYSVSDPFPNPDFAPPDLDMGEDPWETWSRLSDEEQWKFGMVGLRRDRGLRIDKKRLAARYGHGLSGADFMACLYAQVEKQA